MCIYTCSLSPLVSIELIVDGKHSLFIMFLIIHFDKKYIDDIGGTTKLYLPHLGWDDGKLDGYFGDSFFT